MTSLAEYYRELGDDALADAYSQGPAAYDAQAWAVIATEVAARHLPLEAPSTASRPDIQSSWAFYADVEGRRELESGDGSVEARAHAEARAADRQAQLGALIFLIGLMFGVGSYFSDMQASGFRVGFACIVLGLLKLWQADRRRRGPARELEVD